MEDMEPGIQIRRKNSLLVKEPLSEDNSQILQPNQKYSNPLRPLTFDDYPGQEKAKENLKVYVEAAKKRGKVLDHLLLHGPPGLGKTTLANIIARELGVKFYSTSGPSIEKPGDIAGILAGIEEGSLVFIDEIHRLSIHVEEILYSAMEDFSIDIIIGQGPSARTVSVGIPPFTLVGATTKLASLSRPFLNRFGIQERLEYYDDVALQQIITKNAEILGICIEARAAELLAKRSRGTPRIANRLLRRVLDFADVTSKHIIDESVVEYALSRLEIDHFGLDRLDKSILRVICEDYQGGPVGIDAISVTLGEERSTIEEVYEPYLIYIGFINRSPRGRVVTLKGKKYLDETKKAH